MSQQGKNHIGKLQNPAIFRAYALIQELRVPIRIELTEKTKDGEPLYAVQDFLATQPNVMMTIDEMPAWMRERFSMLLINKEHMFEIDGVGFCYDGTTFYIRGEEIPSDDL